MQEQHAEYAGFWVRVGATIIDTILIMLITFPLLVSIYGWAYFDTEQTGFIAGPADFLITNVSPAIAVILFWLKKTSHSWQNGSVCKSGRCQNRKPYVSRSSHRPLLCILCFAHTALAWVYLGCI